MKIAAQSDDAIFPPETPSSVLANMERLQEDMELISYVVSHDLLTPVRTMLQYCDILKKKNALSPNPMQQATPQPIYSEALRMQALLQGLQEYIRLETFAVKHIVLDLNEIISAAIDTLGTEIRSVGALITYDSLPMVTGHRGRLVRLFAYLIDNAIKFCTGQPPKIRVSAQRAEDNMWTFCVEDNGIGIAEEYQEVIFRLFQRLHTNEIYPGYGTGLALSQKIVMSHGGRLWVESALGQGSRFFFTLPGT